MGHRLFRSAWLHPQTSWNRNSSVARRPSVRVAIISAPNARICSKFWLLLPLGHTLGLFWGEILFYLFLYIYFFYEYFSFSLTWDPIGARISKRYSCKSLPKVFKLLLTFLPNGPHETAFGMFEILSFQFLAIFSENFEFTIVAYGATKTQLSAKGAIV